MSKLFKTAYVLEKGKMFNGDALEPYAEEVSYVLSGAERDESIIAEVTKGLSNFDPSSDVIIPAGRVIGSFLAGYMLRKFEAIVFGVYEDKEYTFMTVHGNHLDG